MVAWFLIAIATLIIFAFIAVNSVQSLAMASDAGGRIETVKRLDIVASALISRATSPQNNGVFYLPVGENNPAGAGYGLPAYLGFQTQTPFGQRFVYCPFGDTGGTGATLTIPNADGTSYNVATASFDGRDYVVGGRPAYPGLTGQPNLIGFVMAPRSKLSAAPSCGDVVYNSASRRFEAPDAIVRPLTREHGVDETRTINSREVIYYVSPTGTGTGASPSDTADLSTALNFYKTRQPPFMTIRMSGGNYFLANGELNTGGGDRTTGSTLKIVGDTGNTTVTTQPGGVIATEGDLSVEGVDFDSNSVFTVGRGETFNLINSTVGRVLADGSVVVSGTNAVTYGGTGYSFVMNASANLALKGTINFVTPNGLGFFLYPGAELTAQNSVLSFRTGTGAIYNTAWFSQGGEVKLNSVTAQFPDGISYAVTANGGILDVFYSDFAFSGAQSNYIMLLQGGVNLRLSNSTMGTGVPPVFGIRDHSASSVSGTATSIWATNQCWFGELFVGSPVGQAGNNSATQADVVVTNLPGSPTSAQIQNYANDVALNAKRAAARRNNRSSWDCNP